MRYQIDDDLHADVVVCGGGLAGCCAALAAARQGVSVILIHDRPVLGGNASSEIRVTVQGASCFHAYARETGIINEILTAERARNHEAIRENGWGNSSLDMVLYDLMQQESTLTLWLNTSIIDVEIGGITGLEALSQRPPANTTKGYAERPACAEGEQIDALIARVANAEKILRISANNVVDCTGDALVADLAGCGWRMGTESQQQTNEPHAPLAASTDTMGNSIHIRARDIGIDAPFEPPSWAVKHDDPAFFYDQGRVPHDLLGGYWWMEIGVPWNTIHDNETIRHELTRHAMGIWDWIKNKDERTKDATKTFALDWVGQVPGKRESRRVNGLHWLTEHDLARNQAYDDTVAFGGWFIDLHTPGGLLADSSEPVAVDGLDSHAAARSYVGPYAIPLRALIAADVNNMFMAGRNVSASHVALGSIRVMGTTAAMGQAVGTAAAIAAQHQLNAHELSANQALIKTVQQKLQGNDVFLPFTDGLQSDPELTFAASSTDLLSGIGEDDNWVNNGQGKHDLPELGYRLDEIESCGQIFFTDGNAIESLAVRISGPGNATLHCAVKKLDHHWDYRRDAPVIASTTMTTGDTKSTAQDLVWELNQQLPAGCYRLELSSPDPIIWHAARGMLSTCYAHIALDDQRMKRAGNGHSMVFSIAPPMAVFEPGQVADVTNRPYQSPQCWRSDPEQSFPQSLSCQWPQERQISEVTLTFAGHLLRDLYAEPPFFRDAQCVRDYRIQTLHDGEWQDQLVIAGNFQRLRRHCFPQAIVCQGLRVVVEATNGDPSAQIYVLQLR